MKVLRYVAVFVVAALVVIGLSLMVLASAAQADPVELLVVQRTDVPIAQQRNDPRYGYAIVHQEQHPDYASCNAAARDYTDTLVAQQGWERLAVNKVRTPLGKTPGYMYLELNCGNAVSASKAASESVKKLTDRFNELAEAIRRAREAGNR
jgi:hypothetical protein